MNVPYCLGDCSLWVTLLHDTSPSARRVLSWHPIDCVGVVVLILALWIPKVSAHGLLLYQIQVSLHQHPLGVSPQTEEVLPRWPEGMMIVC